MLKLILQFFIGLCVGIYGYLTPSYINLSVLQVSLNKDKRSLRKMLLVISLVEIPYCIICMSGMKWIMQQEILLFVIKWLIVVIMLALAFVSIRQAGHRDQKNAASTKKIESGNVKRILLLAIFNPFQLSAWAIWGTYFIEKTWFNWTLFSIVIFSLGAAIGVFLILWLYAFMGSKLVTAFSLKRKKIDYGVAIILIILAIVQIIKNLYVG